MTVYTPATPRSRRRTLRATPVYDDIQRGMAGVYFIALASLPFVKIGFTKDIYQRKASMQTNCPFMLKLIAFYPAKSIHERYLHQLLSASCHRDEWFAYTRQIDKTLLNLDAVLARGKAKTSDPAVLAYYMEAYYLDHDRETPRQEYSEDARELVDEGIKYEDLWHVV